MAIQTTTPDGRQVALPVQPTTWVEGQRVPVQNLYADVSATVAWARRRTQFLGMQSAAQSVSSSSWTALDLDTEIIDTDGGHARTSLAEWLAPDSTSTFDYYLIIGYVPINYSGGTGATIAAGLDLGGGLDRFEGSKISASGAHVATAMIVELVDMTPGIDFVRLLAWQNTGSSQNTLVTSKTPSLQVRWVGSTGTSVDVPSPHTWVDADRATADATGTVGGHVLVPFNREIRDVIRWLNRPAAVRVTSVGTSQTVAANTWTAINMTTETIDTHGMWAVSPNPSRIVCTQPGLYFVSGLYATASDASPASYVQARLRHTIAAGGTADYYGQSAMRATGASSPGDAVYANAYIRMAAGDYVELMGWQNDGTKAVLGAAARESSRLIAVWRRA
jgi:hypothetical protein